MSVMSTLRAIPTLWGGVLPAVVIVADQISKWAAAKAFDLPMNICATNPDIHLEGLRIEVSPIADLSLYCNQGISWGLLQGDSALKRWALLGFAIVMVAVLYNLLASAQDRLTKFFLGLLIGGAIGNAIDRALFGAVTDFINASDVRFNYVFNVADSAITVGIIGLFATMARDSLRQRRAAKAGAAK